MLLLLVEDGAADVKERMGSCVGWACEAGVATPVPRLTLFENVVAAMLGDGWGCPEATTCPLLDFGCGLSKDDRLAVSDAAFEAVEVSFDDFSSDVCVKLSLLIVAAPGPVPSAATDPICLDVMVAEPLAVDTEDPADAEAKADDAVGLIKLSLLIVAAPGPLPSAATEPICFDASLLELLGFNDEDVVSAA